MQTIHVSVNEGDTGFFIQRESLPLFSTNLADSVEALADTLSECLGESVSVEQAQDYAITSLQTLANLYLELKANMAQG